jgi:hypothetical protein
VEDDARGAAADELLDIVLSLPTAALEIKRAQSRGEVFQQDGGAGWNGPMAAGRGVGVWGPPSAMQVRKDEQLPPQPAPGAVHEGRAGTHNLWGDGGEIAGYRGGGDVVCEQAVFVHESADADGGAHAAVGELDGDVVVGSDVGVVAAGGCGG